MCVEKYKKVLRKKIGGLLLLTKLHLMSVTELYKLFLSSTGVCTDTRKILKGSIFFSLKGPNFNANSFAQQAIEQGAALAVIDEKEFAVEGKTILVDDVLKTLQQLALQHRRNFKCPVITITGSNGKTTTKELVFSVLSSSFKTYCTQGNLNNHIGVPLTLLSIPTNAEMVVIELGANHLNENKFLCELAEPDFGIITNNGKDHLEGYGSLEGVRKGNGEVYEFLKDRNATAFVSAYQEDLIQESHDMNRIIYGTNEGATVTAQQLNSFPYLRAKLFFADKENFEVQTQLVGKYNLENILVAAAIGFHFKVEKEKIKSAIENYKPANNRSQQILKDGNSFILDAYNANPSSMKLALENFSEFPIENKIVVLGEMAELGKFSLEEHLLILKQLMEMKLKEIWLVGKEFSDAVENLKPQISILKSFKDVDALKKYYQRQKFSGYYFLMKGSRINKLEKMID